MEAISIKNSIEMDLHLSPGQKGQARAFQMMLEHHLYWLILIERWVSKQGQFMWDIFQPKFWWSRFCMKRTIGSTVSKMKVMSASLQHRPENVVRALREDLQSVEDFLQHKV